MFENSPIIKDHSRPAVKLVASGIIMGLCEILMFLDVDYVTLTTYIIVYQHYVHTQHF